MFGRPQFSSEAVEACFPHTPQLKKYEAWRPSILYSRDAYNLTTCGRHRLHACALEALPLIVYTGFQDTPLSE